MEHIETKVKDGTHVRIRRETAQRLKIVAAISGRTMSEMLDELIAEKLPAGITVSWNEKGAKREVVAA